MKTTHTDTCKTCSKDLVEGKFYSSASLDYYCTDCFYVTEVKDEKATLVFGTLSEEKLTKEKTHFVEYCLRCEEETLGHYFKVVGSECYCTECYGDHVIRTPKMLTLTLKK